MRRFSFSIFLFCALRLEIHIFVNKVTTYQFRMLLMMSRYIVECQHFHYIFILSELISRLTFTKLAQLSQHRHLALVETPVLAVKSKPPFFHFLYVQQQTHNVWLVFPNYLGLQRAQAKVLAFIAKQVSHLCSEVEIGLICAIPFW